MEEKEMDNELYLYLGYFSDEDLEEKIAEVMAMPDTWQVKFFRDFCL
jgi:hypothetical protein